MLINKIKTYFPNYLRPNLYRVIITTPFSNKYADELTVLCKDATLPFFTLVTKQIMVNNRKSNIVQDVDYDPANFVFYLDSTNIVLSFFDEWMQLQKPTGDYLSGGAFTHGIGYKEEYAGRVEIELLDNLGNTKLYCILMNAFPTNINDISLGYDQNDAISTLTTNFVFDEVFYILGNNNGYEPDEYTSHMEKRQDPYLDKSLFGRFFSSVGYPLEELRKRVGGVIGQENLRKIESRLNVNVNDSITSGNNLTRKAEKNFSIASNASSNASEAITKPFF